MAELASVYGGIENFHAEQKVISDEAEKAWNSDIVSIGRVLRSHLYVEYYLNTYLEKKLSITKKQLGDLSFDKKNQKLKNSELENLVPSIKKINRIRNKMSHNLNAMISNKDADHLKSIECFKPYYLTTKRFVGEIDPIKTYEIYCQFIAQNIIEALNPNQDLINNVRKAMTKDLVDVYRGNLPPRSDAEQ